MKSLFVSFFVLFTAFPATSTLYAQDFNGQYSCLIEKDGYKVTLVADIMFDGSEYWGTLAAEGSAQFSIEIWGLKNGDFLDLYYNGGDRSFKANAHLFSLGNTRLEPTTFFNDGLTQILKHLDTTRGFKYVGPPTDN